MSEYPNGNKITIKKSISELTSNIKYHESFDISNLYTTSGLYVENVDHLDNTLHLFCKSSDSSSVCTYCGYKSKHVLSRYQRDVNDLSILDREVLLTLEVSSFVKTPIALKRPLPSNLVMRYFVIVAVPADAKQPQYDRDYLCLLEWLASFYLLMGLF